MSLVLLSTPKLEINDPTTSQQLELPKQRRRRKIKEKTFCLICNELVTHKHFASNVCNSCAAFFRRSVSQSRSYFCRQSEACQVGERRHKNRCAFCRFNRCLEVGMRMDKVLSEGVTVQLGKLANNTVLGTLQRQHHAIFILRRRFSIELYGTYTNMWETKRVAQTFLQSTEVERLVMKEFFRNIGLTSEEVIGSEYESSFCAQFLPLWMLLEIVFNTRLHGGHRSKKLYYVDDSYLQYNEDCLVDFYNSHRDIYNPSSLARTCMSLYEKYFHVTELLHRLAIDESERMAIVAFCVYRRTILIAGPNPNMQKAMDSMFKDLEKYYESTYNSVAVRFGQLMLCVEAIEEAHTKIVQQLTIVSLNLKNAAAHGQNCCYSVSYLKG
ncbi:Retinoic acid receptor RXR-beta-A-like protein [Aphelenchoides bicaudatus]|nr:Retinoic acid receptor RXR-beta-A-like protein [Aphelenchoides bicaudatus]